MDLSRLSDEDLKALAANRFDAVSERGLRIIAGEVPEEKKGLGAAVVGGAKRLGSTLQTAVESITAPEEAARRGVERQKAISEE